MTEKKNWWFRDSIGPIKMSPAEVGFIVLIVVACVAAALFLQTLPC